MQISLGRDISHVPLRYEAGEERKSCITSGKSERDTLEVCLWPLCLWSSFSCCFCTIPFSVILAVSTALYWIVWVLPVNHWTSGWSWNVPYKDRTTGVNQKLRGFWGYTRKGNKFNFPVTCLDDFHDLHQSFMAFEEQIFFKTILASSLVQISLWL